MSIKEELLSLLIAERLEGHHYVRIADIAGVRSMLDQLGFRLSDSSNFVYKDDYGDMRVVLHPSGSFWDNPREKVHVIGCESCLPATT